MEEKIDSLFALPYDFYTETGFRKTGLKKLAQMKQFFTLIMLLPSDKIQFHGRFHVWSSVLSQISVV